MLLGWAGLGGQFEPLWVRLPLPTPDRLPDALAPPRVVEAVTLEVESSYSQGPVFARWLSNH